VRGGAFQGLWLGVVNGPCRRQRGGWTSLAWAAGCCGWAGCSSGGCRAGGRPLPPAHLHGVCEATCSLLHRCKLVQRLDRWSAAAPGWAEMARSLHWDRHRDAALSGCCISPGRCGCTGARRSLLRSYGTQQERPLNTAPLRSGKLETDSAEGQYTGLRVVVQHAAAAPPRRSRLGPPVGEWRA
jgi:hypothetical protein